MGQAEWLLVLTCAGYVAPYVWDRLRASMAWHSVVVGVNLDDLQRLQKEAEKARRRKSLLRDSIRAEERNGEFFFPRAHTRPKCYSCDVMFHEFSASWGCR